MRIKPREVRKTESIERRNNKSAPRLRFRLICRCCYCKNLILFENVYGYRLRSKYRNINGCVKCFPTKIFGVIMFKNYTGIQHDEFYNNDNTTKYPEKPLDISMMTGKGESVD